MAVKFNIPAQNPTLKLDLDNIQGLDSKNIAPEYVRAQLMYNFIKKDGLHQIRPAFIQVYSIKEE